MKDVLPQLAFIVYFDYYSRHVNLFITILGIIFNTFHFSILIRKPLRLSPVYIIMLVICICDLAQLLVLIPDDLKYIIEFNHADVCLGLLTYPSAVYTIVADVISRFSLFVSTWMAVVMAVFRSVSIKFAMSSWSDSLSKTSTAYTMLTIVTIISTIYISICSYLKFKIVPSLPQVKCLYTNRAPSQQLFIVYGTDDELSALYFFTMIEGYIQVAQLLLFALSTYFLANAIRESKKKRALMNKNDQRNERTESLILFMLGSFFLAIFPMMLANFTLEYFVSIFSPYVLKASITLMYILQTLNASSHGVICFFISSEYREVAKNAYFPKRRLSVAPAQNFTQHSGN